MPEIEVFEVPVFAEDEIEQIWGGKLRPDELETVLDLYYWAKRMGIVYNQSENMQAIVNLGLVGKKGVKITNSTKSCRKNISWSASNPAVVAA